MMKMAEKNILDLIKKYKKDIIMLDSLLQWALNPTSMSAGYGIEDNYSYIKENLKITHQITDSKANDVIEMLKTDCEAFLALKEDKYSIGNFQKLIIQELSSPFYSKIFVKFILKKKKKANKNTLTFLQTYQFCPVKNFPCVNAQYNAIFGEKISDEELVKLGILKPLYWISSGTSGNRELIPKFIPMLDNIIGNFKLKEIKQGKPNITGFIQDLRKRNDRITLNFIINLIERNQLCDYVAKNCEITTEKGILGFYSDPYSNDFNRAGISFLIQEDLTNQIDNLIKEEIKQKTEKIIKILKFEMEKEEKPSGKELIRIADLNIEDIEVYEELMNQLPKESFSENQEIKNKASEAIKKFDDPSLYDLLTTLNYDIKTARKVGKFLIDSKMINSFSRVPKDIPSSTSLLPSQGSSEIERIFCNNCGTPLSDRDNPVYCPYCGSSDIIKS